jgi:hypothetical protein
MPLAPKYTTVKAVVRFIRVTEQGNSYWQSVLQ